MHAHRSKAFVDPFVKHYWRTLAGAAWSHYLRSGRGALVLEWERVRRWVDGESVAITPAYMTTVGTTGLPTLLQSYDPQTSIVILFLTGDEDDGECAWVFTDVPAPPAAFESSAR